MGGTFCGGLARDSPWSAGYQGTLIPMHPQSSCSTQGVRKSNSKILVGSSQDLEITSNHGFSIVLDPFRIFVLQFPELLLSWKELLGHHRSSGHLTFLDGCAGIHQSSKRCGPSKWVGDSWCGASGDLAFSTTLLSQVRAGWPLSWVEHGQYASMLLFDLQASYSLKHGHRLGDVGLAE